jgi:hypothetical protein
MRRIALLSAVAGIALIAACSKAKDDVPAAPPPPPPPPPNRVTITLTCPNDGGKIGVHPWRINVTKADGVEWSVGANDKSVWITPKDPAMWPFDGDTINVTSGNSVKSTNFKPTVEAGTYRYVVTGVCDNANGPDTVVLDPDMIIPTRIQK